MKITASSITCGVTVPGKMFSISKKVFLTELETKQELISDQRMFGVLYDDSPDTHQEIVTRLSDVSHVVTDVSLDANDKIVCQFEILDTPAGREAKAKLEKKTYRPVARFLGMACIVSGAVQDDFELIRFDLDLQPMRQLRGRTKVNRKYGSFRC